MDAFTDGRSGASSDDGRRQSEGSADELRAAVIVARSLFLMRRHRRNAAQRARRRRFVGSVACGGIPLDSDDMTLRPGPEGTGRELPPSVPQRGGTCGAPSGGCPKWPPTSPVTPPPGG